MFLVFVVFLTFVVFHMFTEFLGFDVFLMFLTFDFPSNMSNIGTQQSSQFLNETLILFIV